MSSLREVIRAKVKRAQESASLDVDDRRAIELGLLPLFDDLAYRYYLRDDGAVYLRDALAPQDGFVELTDPGHRLAIHRAIVEDAPDLAALIPRRPEGHHDCPACRGSGRSPVRTLGGGRSSTICLECRGTGWVPDQAPPSN